MAPVMIHFSLALFFIFISSLKILWRCQQQEQILIVNSHFPPTRAQLFRCSDLGQSRHACDMPSKQSPGGTCAHQAPTDTVACKIAASHVLRAGLGSVRICKCSFRKLPKISSTTTLQHTECNSQLSQKEL